MQLLAPLTFLNLNSIAIRMYDEENAAIVTKNFRTLKSNQSINQHHLKSDKKIKKRITVRLLIRLIPGPISVREL